MMQNITTGYLDKKQKKRRGKNTCISQALQICNSIVKYEKTFTE